MFIYVQPTVTLSKQAYVQSSVKEPDVLDDDRRLSVSSSNGCLNDVVHFINTQKYELCRLLLSNCLYQYTQSNSSTNKIHSQPYWVTPYLKLDLFMVKAISAVCWNSMLGQHHVSSWTGDLSSHSIDCKGPVWKFVKYTHNEVGKH